MMNTPYTIVYLREAGPKILLIFEPRLFTSKDQIFAVQKTTLPQCKDFLDNEHYNNLIKMNANDYYLYGVNERIYNNDTLQQIKVKYLDALSKLPEIKDNEITINYCKQTSLNELYLFVLSREHIDIFNFFRRITDNGLKSITKQEFFEYVQNIMNINPSIFEDKIFEKKRVKLEDIVDMLKHQKNAFIITKNTTTKPESSKSLNNHEMEYLYNKTNTTTIIQKNNLGINVYSKNNDITIIQNPYDIWSSSNKAIGLLSHDQITTRNNSVLTEYQNNIEYNTIYITHAKDVFEFWETNEYEVSGLSKYYFPHLYKLIQSGMDYDTIKNDLLKKTQTHITSTLQERQILYKLNENTFTSSLNGLNMLENIDIINKNYKKIDIKTLIYKEIHIHFKQYLQFNIPVENYFKLIHCTKNVPYIQLNPGKRKQNVYKFYTEQMSENGEQIPFLDRSIIINLNNMVPKEKNTSFYIQNIFDVGDDKSETKPYSSKSCSAFVILYSNGSYEIIMEGQENTNINEIETYIKLQLTNLFSEIINTLIENGIKFDIIQNFNNKQTEIKNINVQLDINTNTPYDFTYLERNQYPVFSVQDYNVKEKSISFIYKRVSNYDNMSAIESFIVISVNNGLKSKKIIQKLQDNFGLKHADAKNEYEKWLSNAIVEANAYNNKRLKIKDNPGIICTLKNTNSNTNDYIFKTTNIKNINDIQYLLFHFLITCYTSTYDYKKDKLLTSLYKKSLNEKIKTPKSSKSTSKTTSPTGEKLEYTFDILGDIGIKANEAKHVEEQIDDIFDLDGAEIHEGSNDEIDGDDEELLDLLAYDDDDYDEEDDDEEDEDETGEGNRIIKEKQSGGAITDSAKKLVGKSLHNPNILFSRMVDRDPKLFLVKSKGGFNAYSRLCPSNVGRQPIILTEDEKERIDRENPESYTKALKYGSTEDKQHYYICPRYWCLSTNTSMDIDDVKAGKCGGSDKIIPKDAKVIPTDAFVIEANGGLKEHMDKSGNYIDHYPGFTKEKTSHPDGLCVPCCFKKWDNIKPGKTIDKQGKLAKRRAQCGNYGPEDLGGKEGFMDGIKKDDEVKGKSKLHKKKAEREYIKDIEKFPLEIGRIGLLPLNIQELLRTDNQKCQVSLDKKNIRRDTNCILRVGVEDNTNKSIIAVLADLFMGDKEHNILKISKNPYISTLLSTRGHKNIEAFLKSDDPHISIREMIEIIIESFSIDDYIVFNNGKLMRLFMRNDTNTDKHGISTDKHKSSKLYKQLFSRQDKLKKDILERNTEYFNTIVKSYNNFCNYLRDMDEYTNYEYLWDIVCMENEKLFPFGINIVILDMITQDETDNIQIPCPKKSYSNYIFDFSKPTTIIMKKNKQFEPIYIVNAKKKEFVQYKFLYKNMQTLDGNNVVETKNKLLIMLSFFGELLNGCKQLPSMPKIYTFEPAIDTKEYNTLYSSLRESGILTNNYNVVNNNYNKIGVNCTIHINNRVYEIIQNNIEKFMILDKSTKKEYMKTKELEQITLKPVKKGDFDGLFPIVQNKDVMKYIKTGEIWNEEKLREFLKWGEHDMSKEPLKNDSFYWTIYSSTNIIGCIGVHKWKHVPEKLHKIKDEYYTTRFIDPEYQGKGIGTYVMALALKSFFALRPDKKFVVSLSLSNNIASQKSLLKIGFKQQKHSVMVRDSKYNIFIHKYKTGETIIEQFLSTFEKNRKQKQSLRETSREKMKGVFKKGEKITGFIPLQTNEIITSKKGYRFYNDAEYYDHKHTYYFTRLFGVLHNFFSQQQQKYNMFERKNALDITHKLIEDGLIVGYITNTDQFIPLDKPYEDINDSYGIFERLISLKGTDLFLANDKIFDSNFETNEERKMTQTEEIVQNINLESNFYKAYRNTVRFVLNDFAYIDFKNAMVKLLSNITIHYDKKYDFIHKIVSHITDIYINFVEYDKETLKYLSTINNCLTNTTNKDIKLYCKSGLHKDDLIVSSTKSKNKKSNIMKLNIPKTHLISGYSNKDIYIERMVADILDNSFLQNYIMKPHQYLMMNNISLQLNKDEVLLLESELSYDNFKNLKANPISSYIDKNIVPYKQLSNSQILQKYSNKVNILDTYKNIVLNKEKYDMKNELPSKLTKDTLSTKSSMNTDKPDKKVKLETIKFLKKGKKLMKKMKVLNDEAQKYGSIEDASLSSSDLYKKGIIPYKCVDKTVKRIGGVWQKYFTKNTIETKIVNKPQCVNELIVSIINFHTKSSMSLREIKSQLYQEYEKLFTVIETKYPEQTDLFKNNIYELLSREGKQNVVNAIKSKKVSFEFAIQTTGYQITTFDMLLLSKKYDVPIILLYGKQINGLENWYITTNATPIHLSKMSSSKKKKMFIPPMNNRILNMSSNYSGEKLYNVYKKTGKIDFFENYPYVFILKQTTKGSKFKPPTYGIFSKINYTEDNIPELSTTFTVKHDNQINKVMNEIIDLSVWRPDILDIIKYFKPSD